MSQAKLTAKQQAFCEEYLIDLDRFWSYVDVGDDSACWNWKMAKCSNGYGRFHTGHSRNSTALAHRIAYYQATKEKPEAVCHKCDNPSCCNPSHLFGGTRADNNRDMFKKGRHCSQTGSYTYKTGVQHHGSKLTNENVKEIKERYTSDNATQRFLANEYSVSQRTIAKIINGISYV